MCKYPPALAKVMALHNKLIRSQYSFVSPSQMPDSAIAFFFINGK